MALTRKDHNWREEHYHSFLLESVSKPFEWGEWDCCLFAASAIESFTGIDIADEFRGVYDTEESAFALIKELTGGTNVADAAAYCAQKHGIEERQHPLMAQRGDLVVIQNGDTLIAGVVHLNGRHVVTISEKGLVRLPITKVVRSWSV